MKYEGVSFNKNAVLKFNTYEEFIFHKSYQHLWPNISEEKRHERLKEVWQLINAMNF